jgi:multidrug efflux pump subunit AcrB
MVRFLVERPVAVLVSFFALLLLGVTAYFKLTVSLLPEVDVPAMMVRTQASDLSISEIESRVSTPLRNALMQVRGVEHVESISSEGESVVKLRLNHQIDIRLAFIEVNEKIDLQMNNLPNNIRPLVTKMGIADIPVFRLNMVSVEDEMTETRLAEMSSFAREIIRRRIEQIPEVGMVDMTGITQPQVQIKGNDAYLKSMGLTDQALQEALTRNQINVSNISVIDGQYRYFLKISSGIQNLEALRATPLLIGNRLMKLGDLATVKYNSAPSVGSYFANAKRGVNFAVIKQMDARVDDLQEHFNALMEQFKKDYPHLHFEVSQDQTYLLDHSISNLQQDLVLGGMLAFFLMLVFIRKPRMAILIGITMPLSLLVSMLGFHMVGMSFNIISLGGLILGLSMIIDSSIVVMDTISNQRNKGLNVIDAAVVGTNEIIRPLITSVLTNCAVFVPLIFLSGMAGAIFYDQAISIVIGVISSLLVAIILLPPLFRLVYAPTEKKDKKRFEIKALVHVTGWYEKVLHQSFKHPWLVIFIVVGVFVTGIFLFMAIDKSRLPDITRNDMEMNIDWNEPLSTEENERRTLSLVALLDTSETKSNTWVGQQSYLLPLTDDLGLQQAQLYVYANDAAKLSSIQNTLAEGLTERYPQAIFAFTPGKNAFDEVFADHLPPLRVLLQSANSNAIPPLDSLQNLIAQLREALPHARISAIATYDKIVIQPKLELLVRYGLQPMQVRTKIRQLLESEQLGNYQASDALVPMVLSLEKPKSLYHLLQENHVQSPQGDQIPLAALVDLSSELDMKEVYAGLHGKYYPVNIETDQPAQDLEVVEEILEARKGQVRYSMEGAYFNNLQLMKEMAIILCVAVLLLYFILAAQFESLIQPLFILVELPVAMCGALLFLYLGGSSVNIMSMIGIVVMSGLIINDSILKIDAINQLRRQGMPLMEAIFEGGHRRLKSIIMITLTSIGALAPTLWMSDLGSELQKPLALALIGGMTVGLLISLFFVPLVYWFVYRKKENV